MSFSIRLLPIAILLFPGWLAAADLNSILQSTNTKGGLIVHLGCQGNQKVKLDEAFLFHGLNTDGKEVDAFRSRVRASGAYGRISASVYDGKRLPYAENMVNLLIVEDPAELSQSELTRVLVPDGVVVRKSNGAWRKKTKLRPNKMDEWPQWLHGPDNVLVSKDTLVGPPRRLKWMAHPTWSRMHNDIDVPASSNIILSAGGRLIHDADLGFPDSDKMPHRFVLFCRDAFNGKLLWKRKMEEWYKGIEYRRGNPPVILQRRIVCDGDRIYATFSNDGPVEVLDAATGKTLKTIQNSNGAHELVLADGRLFLVFWKYQKPVRQGYTRRGGFKSSWHAEDPTGKQKGNASITPFYHQPVETSIRAIDLKSEKTIWERKDKELNTVFPQTLAISSDRAFCKTPDTLLCLDATTGKTIWTSAIGKPLKDIKKISKWYWVHNPTPWYWNSQNISRVNALPDKILTVADNTLYAVAKDSGKVLWTTPCSPAFVNPPDFFPIGDTLYISKKGYQAIDLKTGTRNNQMSVGPTGTGHARCYRRLATDKYILSSQAGIEFMDFQTGKPAISQWTRGNCFSGFIPANGLTYMTPHPCACFTGARMNGMLAYAAAGEVRSQPFTRLRKGPAFGKVDAAVTKNEPDARLNDWPMFRQNSKRGNASGAAVSAKLDPSWKINLGIRLSPVSVVGDAIYISSIEEHTVHTLDADTGKLRWSYMAGGRVDTPPSISGDFAVFGSRDGWTYCLNRANGELAWRFHGGPEERLIGVHDQLESAWPVHGSVLILSTPKLNDGNPIVYLLAGRSTFLDSGLFVYGLDLRSGAVVVKKQLDGPYGEDGNPILVQSQKKKIKGIKADIMVSDGMYLYIKDLVLNLDCSEANTKGMDHLVATGRSLLDGYWHHRSLSALHTDAPYYAGQRQHAGNVMSFDGEDIYSFRSHSGGRNSTFKPADGYQLGRFRINRAAQEKLTKSPSVRRGEHITDIIWKRKVQIICKAMIVARREGAKDSETVLLMAGAKNPGDPLLVESALQNKNGGVLQLYSGTEGKLLSEITLSSLPVYDGMAVSRSGHLIIAQQDGQLVCLTSIRQ